MNGFLNLFCKCRCADAATKQDLRELEVRIMTALERIENHMALNQTELASGLKQLQTQVGKVAKEQSDRFDTLTAKIKELEDLLNAGNVTPEVEAAFGEVKTALQALDDTIPDAPPVP